MQAESGTTVVTVSYNTAPLTTLLLWSLHRVVEKPVREVVVVDNASTDGSAELLRDLERAGVCTVLANDRNLGHGPALNQAVAAMLARSARPERLWILDSDCVDRDHPLYDWALSHREPHFGGILGAAERYGDLLQRFQDDLRSSSDSHPLLSVLKHTDL